MALIHMTLFSNSLMRDVEVSIIYPEIKFSDGNAFKTGELSYKNRKPYPVLYLLHGYGGNNESWINYSSIVRYASERNICVVLPSGENSFYNNGIESNYYNFFSYELPDFIENTFNVSSRREDRYIAGLSMGGYGALALGLTNKDRYNAIGAFSAAINVNDSKINLRDAVKEEFSKDHNHPSLFIKIGNKDFLYLDNNKFHEFLNENNVPHEYIVEDGYAHEWRLWDKVVEEFLDWIDRTDSYKDNKSGV